MKHLYKFLAHILFDTLVVLTTFVGTVVLCYHTEKATGCLSSVVNVQTKAEKTKKNRTAA